MLTSSKPMNLLCCMVAQRMRDSLRARSASAGLLNTRHISLYRLWRSPRPLYLSFWNRHLTALIWEFNVQPDTLCYAKFEPSLLKLWAIHFLQAPTAPPRFEKAGHPWRLFCFFLFSYSFYAFHSNLIAGIQSVYVFPFASTNEVQVIVPPVTTLLFACIICG